jgi:raffinose/stachyose/melibiose transport system permease protein
MLIYVILLTTLMVPVASIVLPLAIMLKFFGWINSYQGLILPYAALGIPYAIVIIKSFMDDSPRDLFEAAMIDGCTNRQMFFHVALPLVKPALIFVAIWQFIVTWNEFFLALVVMTDSEHKTVTFVPMQYSGMYMANPEALAPPPGQKPRRVNEPLISMLRYSVQVPLKIGSCEQVRRISTRSAFDPKFFVSWPDPR